MKGILPSPSIEIYSSTSTKIDSSNFNNKGYPFGKIPPSGKVLTTTQILVISKKRKLHQYPIQKSTPSGKKLH
jgi:hypothetical protein